MDNNVTLAWRTFPGGKTQVIATIHCTIRDVLKCSDEVAVIIAREIFDKITDHANCDV